MSYGYGMNGAGLGNNGPAGFGGGPGIPTSAPGGFAAQGAGQFQNVLKGDGSIHVEMTSGPFRYDLTDGSRALYTAAPSGALQPVMKNGRITAELTSGPMRIDLGHIGLPDRLL